MVAQRSAVDEVPPCLLTRGGGITLSTSLLPLPSVVNAHSCADMDSSFLSPQCCPWKSRKRAGGGGGRREDGQVIAGN